MADERLPYSFTQNTVETNDVIRVTIPKEICKRGKIGAGDMLQVTIKLLHKKEEGGNGE